MITATTEGTTRGTLPSEQVPSQPKTAFGERSFQTGLTLVLYWQIEPSSPFSIFVSQLIFFYHKHISKPYSQVFLAAEPRPPDPPVAATVGASPIKHKNKKQIPVPKVVQGGGG